MYSARMGIPGQSLVWGSSSALMSKHTFTSWGVHQAWGVNEDSWVEPGSAGSRQIRGEVVLEFLPGVCLFVHAVFGWFMV